MNVLSFFDSWLFWAFFVGVPILARFVTLFNTQRELSKPISLAEEAIQHPPDERPRGIEQPCYVWREGSFKMEFLRDQRNRQLTLTWLSTETGREESISCVGLSPMHMETTHWLCGEGGTATPRSLTASERVALEAVVHEIERCLDAEAATLYEDAMRHGAKQTAS